MADYEREPTSRHTRNPSYTEKPVKIHGQSRDRSSKIFTKARKDSNPETHGNQGAEFGITSSNNNAGQVNWMNSNVVKLSDTYNQKAEDNIPQSSVDLNVSKRNTGVDIPSRLPTPTLRRTKNLSKSSPEELIRPGRQMNERSNDFILSSKRDYEGDSPMIYGDGSPSPATKTVPQKAGNVKRAHSLSTGAYYTDQTIQEKVEMQSFKAQSDQNKKEIIFPSKKPFAKGIVNRQKPPETPKKATNKIEKRNTLQKTAQKKSSPSKPPVYSKAQNKIEAFGKAFSKELSPNSNIMVGAKESIDQEIEHWTYSLSNDNSPKPTMSASTSVETSDSQDDHNQKLEDSIDFTTEKIITSPKLTTVQKRFETDSKSDANSAPKNLSNGIEFSPKWSSKSPISPSENLSRLDSERKEIFKYRGQAKLSDMTNGSTLEELQSISDVDDISKIPQNAPEETRDEQTKKDVEFKSNMPILDADNSLETKKKKQSESSAVTQTLANALQKYPEKLNFNSKTEKDQKSEKIMYSLDSSPLINSGKKMKLKDSEKLPFNPKFDVDPEERIAAEARLFEPQVADNKSEVNLNSEMSPTILIPTKKGKNDETPKIDLKILPIETPKVIGAFIETPSYFSNLGKNSTKGYRRRAISLESQDYIQGITLNTKRTRLKDHNPSQQIQLQRGLTRSSAIPNIINTAHRITASEDLRLIKKEENIQDSDLDYLIDEIANLNENIDIDELLANLYDRALDPELDHYRSHLSQVKNWRSFVDLMMERMKQKLDSASHNFQDLKNSLERLEQQVASTSPFDKTTMSAECSKDNNFYNTSPIFSIISSWLYIRVSSSKPTRLFRDRNWRFTWLGLTLLIFLLWYVAELAMCAVFCHPKYSNKNTWQPSDPFFPWAIPTKLDQWTGRFISEGVGTILDLFHYPTPTHYWPTHLYSGYDWWEGRSGPSTSFHFGASNADFGVGNINDDELLK